MTKAGLMHVDTPNMDSQKIGILTFHRSNNYGAMFQAYALSRFLENLGHDVFIVNYHIDVPTLKGYLLNPVAFIGKMLGKKVFSLKFLKAKTVESKGKGVEQEFAKIFEDFRETYLTVTPDKVYFDDLVQECPDADVFIVGSDQVWSTDFVFSSPAYLLAFAPPDKKKISYAASFGKAKLERFLEPVFKEKIQDFDSISVREKSGVDLVKNLTGLDATHVVDPTLLISDYDEIIDYSLVPEGDYVLYYRLSTAEELSQWIDESVCAIAEDLGAPLYFVSTNADLGQDSKAQKLQSTPGQLLGLIEKARFFATNSFHGTVFAIKLRTCFLTFARDSFVDKQNLRLTELLGAANAMSCYCEAGIPVDEIVNMVSETLDFDQMHSSLEPRRQSSVAFLKEALAK